MHKNFESLFIIYFPLLPVQGLYLERCRTFWVVALCPETTTIRQAAFLTGAVSVVLHWSHCMTLERQAHHSWRGLSPQRNNPVVMHLFLWDIKTCIIKASFLDSIFVKSSYVFCLPVILCVAVHKAKHSGWTTKWQSFSQKLTEVRLIRTAF